MTPEVAALQVQIAAIQANVEWLTRLVWAMITLNGASLLANGVIGAVVIRNNNKEKG